MDGFAVYYVEANIVCIIVFGIILIHNHFNIDRQEKQIKYDHTLIIFMLYFLLDCVWALIVSGVIPKSGIIVIASNFAVYLLMVATMYFWLQYVMAYEQVPHRNRPLNKFVVLFPFIVSTTALLIHYLIAPQMFISKDMDLLPTYYIYLAAVPYIYLAAIIFYTIRKARSEKNRAEKRKHLFIGFFPIMVMAGGIAQLIFPYIPIYCISVMILMLIFYIQSLDLRISMDPLTQLNNRSQLTHYTASRSNLYMDDKLTFVLIMDIDGFKAINDTYGHWEGDQALVTVSDSLKKVVNSYSMPSFLCRYGGDEFLLIIHPETKEETEHLIRNIRNEFEEVSKKSQYVLSLSIGYDELIGVQDTMHNCIRRADKKLSLDKDYRKIRT